PKMTNEGYPSCVISGVNAHEYRHYAKVGLPHIACADTDAARIHNYLPASTCPKMTKEGLGQSCPPAGSTTTSAVLLAHAQTRLTTAAATAWLAAGYSPAWSGHLHDL